MILDYPNWISNEQGEILAQSNSTIACWAMGLTQHRNGVFVIQEVANLLSWEAT